MIKKGFTLVEVLAVITILGIISVITTATVINIINDARDKLYDKQIAIYEEQAKKWSVDHADELKMDKADNRCITLVDLYESGYLEKSDLKDPRDSSKQIPGGIIITYNESYNQFMYDYNESCS